MAGNGPTKNVNLRGVDGLSPLEGGELKVYQESEVCEENSTSTPLAAGATFTGTLQDCLDYSIVMLHVYSDQASATDGLSVQFSTDGTNWDGSDYYSIPAATGKTYSFQTSARYFRVVYTNGATPQTEFRLQAIKKRVYSKPSSHRIDDDVSGQDDSELVTSVIKAKPEGGTDFTNIAATKSGNLRVTDAESGLAIAKGDVTGTTFIHKFGNAPSFSTTDGIVTIWDAADGSGSAQYQYNYSASANIDSISSSNAGDTVDVEVQGLDANFDLVTQTVTLTGQTTVFLATPLIRAFRMKNVNSVDLVGNVFLYTNGSTVSGGVPTDPTQIRAGIEVPNNQTLMAIYTVPAGKKGYLRDWYAATAAGNKNATYKLVLKARSFGGVFQTKHLSSISDLGTNAYQHKYHEPEVFAEKTDIEMTVQLLSTGVSGASISAGFDIVLVDD